jgi:carbon-monoxide dehydrogenase large subunit
MHHKANRIEDPRLVTGTGRYAADWSLPGQCHAHFVRSDRAHARIVAIDAATARVAPGVLVVLTGEDVEAAGWRSLPCSLALEGIGGQRLRKPPRPVMARGTVRHVGEIVACVVAATAAQAEEAAALVVVEYADLPAVVEMRAATTAGAAELHAQVPGNVAFEYETGDSAKAAEAFARAARVVKLDVVHQRLVGNPMEPRACLASHDAAANVYTLHTSTQGVNALRAQLAVVTRLAEENFRIVAEDVGGGFGVRYNVYPEHCVLVLATQRLSRPVKWVGTRSELFVSDEQGRAVESTGEVALDSDGRFLAFRFHYRCDMGAYLTATGPFIDIQNTLETLSGVYAVPALVARFDLIMTNTVPIAAYRGAGRPLASYMVERLVEQAARELGIDRVELRRRNLVQREAFPYKTPNAGSIDCGDFQRVLEIALQASRWDGFEARRAQALARGRLRGIGLACYIEFSSPGFHPRDEVEIRFGAAGEATLHSVTHSSGQSHETSFAAIVADVLGYDPARIRHRAGDPDVHLVGSATGGSRSLFAVGSVFKLAAQKVVEQGRTLAAGALGLEPAQVVFAEGTYRAAATGRSITLERIAAGNVAQPHPLDVKMDARIGGNYPNGCHVAEVEIDPETGAVAIIRYVGVDDCGTVINAAVVEGQVHGGVVQGVGQALLEQAVFDPTSGQLLTGSFMDYAMPRAGGIRDFEVHEHPVPTKANPLGAKGVGEAGATGAPPTVMNAVLDALRPVGVHALDAPATPARVWAAIRSACGQVRRAPANSEEEQA